MSDHGRKALWQVSADRERAAGLIREDSTAKSACRLGIEKIILPQLDINHKPCNLAELLPRIKQEGLPHDA